MLKDRWTNFLLFSGLFLLCLVLYLLLVNTDKNDRINGYRKERDILKQQVKIWKDKEKLTRAEARAFEAEGKVVKEVMQEKWVSIQKDIEDLKRIKNLRSRTEIKTLYKDTLYIPLKDTIFLEGDSSIKYLSFNYVDSSGYNRINGIVKNGTITINPEIEVPLVATIYRKRKPKKYFFDFFPGKETVVQSKSLNPKVIIQDVEAVVIKPRKRFLGIF